MFKMYHKFALFERCLVGYWEIQEILRAALTNREAIHNLQPTPKSFSDGGVGTLWVYFALAANLFDGFFCNN
jgi:hypothetical protein